MITMLQQRVMSHQLTGRHKRHCDQATQGEDGARDGLIILISEIYLLSADTANCPDDGGVVTHIDIVIKLLPQFSDFPHESRSRYYYCSISIS